MLRKRLAEYLWSSSQQINIAKYLRIAQETDKTRVKDLFKCKNSTSTFKGHFVIMVDFFFFNITQIRNINQKMKAQDRHRDTTEIIVL